MRYWNSVNLGTENFSQNFIANGFAHPRLLVLSEVDNEPTLRMAKWGLVPSWVKDAKQADEINNLTLNAQGETIFEKPSFANSAKHSRCIIPVNGFYEWQKVESKKLPYYISLKDDEIFSLGGLLSEWTDGATGEKTKTFSIVTVEANHLMHEIHNTKFRMPLILSSENEKEWINASTASSAIQSLIAPFPDNGMQAWQVSPFGSNPTARI